jgi:NADPH:quinone reductase-like Zn-dependent oxidoreductase
MKALQIQRYGGSDVLELNPNAPSPNASKEHVLVKVHAASINSIDWKIRFGYLQEHLPLALPTILGGDFSGIVTELGGSNSNLKVGNAVYGYGSPLSGGSGSFAENVAAIHSAVARMPQKASVQEAAALPLVGVSAVQALEEHLKLQPGQTLLIHGGGGGIGSLAIQIAKSIGAYVATTATGDDMEYVRKLGADQVIDYKTEAFELKVKEFDAAFDTVGGATTTKTFQTLRRGGRLVSMLGQPDEALAQKHEVTAIEQFTQVTTERLNRLAELIDSGRIKIRIDKMFSLNKGKEAFQLAEEGHPKGKVILEIQTR